MKLSFVPSQNILLAGPFHSALDWVSPLWPGPHQGTPICCLCPLDGGFVVLTEHKCSHKYGFWKYMASISFRNSPNSGVICGTLVVLRIICPQEKPNRHALRTGDIGLDLKALIKSICLQIAPPLVLPRCLMSPHHVGSLYCHGSQSVVLIKQH